LGIERVSIAKAVQVNRLYLYNYDSRFAAASLYRGVSFTPTQHRGERVRLSVFVLGNANTATD